MAAVVNQQQPLPSNTRNPLNYSPSDPSNLATPPPPPPPPSGAPSKSSSKKNKKAGPSNNAVSNDPADAHKALLSKISQLEASTTETAHEAAEIEAEVRKANRELTSLLNTLEPHNSRLDVVQRRYSELLAEMKRVERDYARAKKRGDQLQKEKEEVAKERTRERGLKEKLEKLSRELTRENKRLKEEVRELRESAADRNEELHRKLESLVLDVEELVGGGGGAGGAGGGGHSTADCHRRRGATASIPSSDRQAAVELEQDRMFREKFTSFLYQYEVRELQFQSLIRMKELEAAYHQARHEQLRKAQESELSKSHQLTRQVSTFSQTENELRGQLNVYVEKFKQVEDTLNNSNDLFLTFRKEMEEMSKKTKRLEKENMNLTRKQEATNKNIFQMAEERSQNQQIMEKLTRENEKLKKLCRAMQNGGYGSAAGAAVAATSGAGAMRDGVVSSTGVPGTAEAVDRSTYDEVMGETESEYDEEYDEEEDYEDDDTEEEEDEGDEGIQVQPRGRISAETGGGGPPPMRMFGPPPPPSLSAQEQKERLTNGRPRVGGGQDSQQEALVNGTTATVNGT